MSRTVVDSPPSRYAPPERPTERVAPVPAAIEEIAEMYAGPIDHAVSVVIPAYNEGPHVADQARTVRDAMAATGWRFEVIVVDDGSKDDTAERASEVEGVRVLRRKRNRGYGATLKDGIAAARYDWILIIDADGTYPVSAIPRLLAAADGNAMVVGARIGEHVSIPIQRQPAKKALTWLASYLAGRKIPDLNSGLRLMRKDFVRRYEHLLPQGFSFTSTITLSGAVNDHAVEYIPIDYHARLGKSKIRPRHAYDFTILILRTIVYFNPLKVFLPLGAYVAAAGLAKLGYDVWKDNLSESAVLALLGAMLIWAVGLLADQNARIALNLGHVTAQRAREAARDALREAPAARPLPER
jgi:glycosyltransferase involved in cell wall biosynthesis